MRSWCGTSLQRACGATGEDLQSPGFCFGSCHSSQGNRTPKLKQRQAGCLKDDPICVASQRDGKVLVTGLWVDHSLDTGSSVDPSSVVTIIVIYIVVYDTGAHIFLLL